MLREKSAWIMRNNFSQSLIAWIRSTVYQLNSCRDYRLGSLVLWKPDDQSLEICFCFLPILHSLISGIFEGVSAPCNYVLQFLRHVSFMVLCKVFFFCSILTHRNLLDVFYLFVCLFLLPGFYLTLTSWHIHIAPFPSFLGKIKTAFSCMASRRHYSGNFQVTQRESRNDTLFPVLVQSVNNALLSLTTSMKDEKLYKIDW